MTQQGAPGQGCIVCIAGRPFAGKTTAAAILREERDWPVAEADALGAHALEQDDPPPSSLARGRGRFEYPDAARVEFEAPERFQAELGERLRAVTSPIVLVGLRSVVTVRWLEAHFPRRVCLLYLSARVHVCQRRFVACTGRPRGEYALRLESAIESEQGALHDGSQLVIPNEASLEALRARLRRCIGPHGRGYRTRLEPCSVCGQLRPVHRRVGPERAPLCRRCYGWELNAEPCSRCQQRRPVHYRDAAGLPLCARCYQRTCNVQICANCGRARPVCRRNLDGDPVCKDCRQRGADREHSRPKTSPSRPRYRATGTRGA